MSDFKSDSKNNPILELGNISKSFGHIDALRNASLSAYPGEILSLVGDNGAGKSTLIKIIAGVYQIDSGIIKIDGKSVEFRNASHAQNLGVSTVFQDLAMVETLDVATNLYLGQPIRKGHIFVDRKKMYERTSSLLKELGINLPSVYVPISVLSGGQRQAVAVARAVLQEGKVILMDEPTAALGVREKNQVLDIIRQLRDRGKSIILISHDLDVVFSISNKIQVLRLGQVQGIRKTNDTNREEIVGLITGAITGDDSKNRE